MSQLATVLLPPHINSATGINRPGLDQFTAVIVPGWHGSGPDHWQRRWASELPRTRVVEQSDWEQPRPGDWVGTLERTIQATSGQVVLVAHSLGCITVARWAREHDAERVAGALLVAPADVERPGCPRALRNFAPVPRGRLPFPSLVVGSSNDPAASAGRAAAMASDWAGRFVLLTDVGHINVESGHHRWDEGRRMLEKWVKGLGT